MFMLGFIKYINLDVLIVLSYVEDLELFGVYVNGVIWNLVNLIGVVMNCYG